MKKYFYLVCILFLTISCNSKHNMYYYEYEITSDNYEDVRNLLLNKGYYILKTAGTSYIGMSCDTSIGYIEYFETSEYESGYLLVEKSTNKVIEISIINIQDKDPSNFLNTYKHILGQPTIINNEITVNGEKSQCIDYMYNCQNGNMLYSSEMNIITYVFK